MNMMLKRWGAVAFAFLCMSVSLCAKVERTTVYMFGFSASFTDSVAYITDVKYIPEEEYAKLENLDVLIIDALRAEPHPSHESLGEALANIARIRPKESYLIHMSHRIGLHAVVEKELPPHVHYSYDGLVIEF